MKHRWDVFSVGFFWLLIGLFIISVPNTAEAEVEIFKQGKDLRLSAGGEVVVRSSYWNWFQSTPSSAENEYNHFFTRSRLGILLDHSYIGAYVQGQFVDMWNLPEDSLAPPPQGPLGIGSIYSLHMRERSQHSFALRQAYLDLPSLGLKGLSARIGRFDYMDG